MYISGGIPNVFVILKLLGLPAKVHYMISDHACIIGRVANVVADHNECLYK